MSSYYTEPREPNQAELEAEWQRGYESGVDDGIKIEQDRIIELLEDKGFESLIALIKFEAD